MKTSELKKVMKEIELSNHYIKEGKLAYKMIEHHTGLSILLGIYLDNTSNKESFFVQYFAQCLYVPFPTYNFSLGDRIGSYWKIENLLELNQQIKSSISLSFDKIVSFNDFITFMETHPYYGNEVGKFQYLAYTYFILEDYKKSLYYLDKIIKLKEHSNPEWFQDEIVNAEIIKESIICMNYNQGIKHLLDWQERTISNIKLVPTKKYG